MTRWRVRVTRGELTCLECGETYPPHWHGCPRCPSRDETRDAEIDCWSVAQARSVPTISYLLAGEYEES